VVLKKRAACGKTQSRPQNEGIRGTGQLLPLL